MDYLSEEIQNIKYSILNNEKITISNKKLMEIYSFVYNTCIKDRSADKTESIRLFTIYEESIIDFLKCCHLQLVDSGLDALIKILDKYLFFCKNLNFMFRYLNKFYITKYNRDDIENKVIHLFKNELFPEYNALICEKVKLEMNADYLNTNFLDILNHLIHLYSRYNLNLTDLTQVIRICFEEHYIKHVKTVKDLDDLVVFYQRKMREIEVFSSRIDIDANYTVILLEVLSDLRIKNIISSHFKTIFNKRDMDTLSIMRKINHDLFMKNIEKILDELFNMFDVFERVCLYHEYFIDLSRKIDKELMTIFECKNTAFLKTHPDLTPYMIKNMLDKQKGYFMLKYVENKDHAIGLLGRIFFAKVLNDPRNLDKELFSIQEVKKIVSNSLSIKLDQFYVEIKNSLYMNRCLLDKKMGNVFYFSNTDFLINPIFHFEYNHPEFDQIKIKITDNYKTQFPNRKIRFNYWQSMVFFDFYIKDKKMNIKMPVIQFFVFELILVHKQMNIKKLRDILHLDTHILSAILHSLVHLHPILLKSGSKNKVHELEDQFCINPDFSGNNIAFQLPSVCNKNQDPSGQKENMHVLRANIIWHLKRCKAMSEAELMKKLQMKSTLCINEQLKYLIDNEYIEVQNDTYIYIP